MHLFLAGTKGSRPIYIELCSVHLRSRLGPAIRRHRARPAAPPSSSTPTRPRHSPGPHRAASRLRRCTRSHPPSPRLPARPPPSNSISSYCALDRLPSSSLARPASSTVVEPRPPGLVVELARPPGLPSSIIMLDFSLFF